MCSINVNETGYLISGITYICWTHGRSITHPSLVKASKPIRRLLCWNWICSICFCIPDLNGLYCSQTLFPPNLTGSAPLVGEVTYCIRPSDRGYWAFVCILCNSHSDPYSPPLPLQPLSSLAATLLYWSHNLIKHVSWRCNFQHINTQGPSTLFWLHPPCHWSCLPPSCRLPVASFEFCYHRTTASITSSNPTSKQPLPTFRHRWIHASLCSLQIYFSNAASIYDWMSFGGAVWTIGTHAGLSQSQIYWIKFNLSI